jgi:phage-related protein
VKDLFWVGSALEDLKDFPSEVQDEIGTALLYAQYGGKHPATKPFKGYGSGVYEIISNFNTNTYRAVYVINLDDCVYVLHAFQKKSVSGIKTPKPEINVIEARLKFLKASLKKR